MTDTETQTEASAEIGEPGSRIRETAITFDGAGQQLYAVIAEPVDAPRADLTLVLYNAGAIRRIGPNRMWTEAARRWAAKSPVDDAARKKFIAHLSDIADSFDREAVRLDAFLTMGAREIEAIHVKFRPSTWYCHMIVVRQVIDMFSTFFGNKCTPIRTAEANSTS